MSSMIGEREKREIHNDKDRRNDDKKKEKDKKRVS